MQGNPTKSAVITDLKRGYHNWAFEAGYVRKPATPIPETELQHLLSHMRQQILSSSSQAEKCLLARDGSLFSMLWHTAFRGAEVCKLQLADLVNVSDNSPAAAVLSLHSALPTGHFISVHPYGTKTQHTAHAGSAILQYTPEDITCPLLWLSFSIALAASSTQPIQSWLFRNMDSHCQKFREEPISSSALNNRLTHHLKAAGIYHGQTPHGMRRGHIQHLHHQQYLSLAAASSKAGIRTLAVAAMYADSHSHVRKGRLQ